jgi:DNA-binding SARP family transcriptional activator
MADSPRRRLAQFEPLLAVQAACLQDVVAEAQAARDALEDSARAELECRQGLEDCLSGLSARLARLVTMSAQELQWWRAAAAEQTAQAQEAERRLRAAEGVFEQRRERVMVAEATLRMLRSTVRSARQRAAIAREMRSLSEFEALRRGPAGLP